MELHALGPLDKHLLPEGLITEPRIWQLTGVHKLLHMIQRWHGAILADEMGLGKTLTTIIVCEILRRQSPGIVLIVTTKSCVPQWRDELHWNFSPVSG